ncbi:MAG: prepilin-type N-terminal cleavage/methylation domain-containing protein [Patescibacteria group bacterium]|nr:prepilin-type N-terminal cleavage/methylation domain-containing protein [Patescibacteria group bacterium]
MVNLNSQKGFTLAEILVAISVGLVVVLLAYASYDLALRFTEKENKKVELAQNGRVALDRITRDLRQSQELVTDLPPVSDDPDSPPPAEIMFQDGHTLEPIQYIRYYVLDGSLHRERSHYYFSADPDSWVVWSAVDEFGHSAEKAVDADEVIAEYIDHLIFWGEDRLVHIMLTALSLEEKVDFLTGVCGRNLR